MKIWNACFAQGLACLCESTRSGSLQVSGRWASPLPHRDLSHPVPSGRVHWPPLGNDTFTCRPSLRPLGGLLFPGARPISTGRSRRTLVWSERPRCYWALCFFDIWPLKHDPVSSSALTAQHIHEVVRDTVRALRALPDFNRSPNSNHNPLLVPKRCRPKYREKKNPIVQTGPMQFQEPNITEPQSPISLHSTDLPDHYMDMRKQPCAGECCEGEGVGYMMMMSPQVSRSSCVLPPDAYVTMSSPPKDLSASISSQGGVNRYI